MLLVPLAALLLLQVPLVARMSIETIDRLRRPTRRQRCLIAIGVFLIATAYLTFTALCQGRYSGPIWHDEFSYLLQMRMLAEGRLWMPAHELAEFFDSFQLIVEPVYASMYFPGTALLYVPTIWLGLPLWALPLLAAGACAALLCRIVTELLDGVAGLLAAAMLLSLGVFRLHSVMLLSQVPVLLMGLLALWAVLRWRADRHWRWITIFGAAAAWGLITRPLDALCLSVPAGVTLLAGLVRGPRPLRAMAGAGLAALLSASPFLALQLWQNHGVTGSALRTPWSLYASQKHPQVRLGFPAYDPAIRPSASLAQIQDSYHLEYAPLIQAHTPASVPRRWLRDKLPRLLAGTAPSTLLLLLAPAGLLSLGRGRWLMPATLPLFIGFYALYALLPDHYRLTAAPAVIALVLLGSEAVRTTWPRTRRLGAFLVLTVAMSAFAALPEWSRRTRDQYWNPVLLKAADAAITHEVQAPAIILFTYSEGRRLDEEPVYNTDTAWPDDAPVIRAHDLGVKNTRLVEYYAQRQPARRVYRFDEKDRMLHSLGTAGALAAKEP